MRTIQVKKLVLELAEAHGNTTKICREYHVPRSTFYRWKEAYAKDGDDGLVRRKPIMNSHPRQLSPEVVENILHLRQIYHLGPERITWYLERYHAVQTSSSSVYRTLIRHGLRRLPRNVGRRPSTPSVMQNGFLAITYRLT